MIKACIDDLLVKSNKGCSVFIHNSKNFDYVFIIRALLGTDIDVTNRC